MLGTGLQRCRGRSERGMKKAIFETDRQQLVMLHLGLLCAGRTMVVICLCGNWSPGEKGCNSSEERW